VHKSSPPIFDRLGYLALSPSFYEQSATLGGSPVRHCRQCYLSLTLVTCIRPATTTRVSVHHDARWCIHSRRTSLDHLEVTCPLSQDKSTRRLGPFGPTEPIWCMKAASSAMPKRWSDNGVQRAGGAWKRDSPENEFSARSTAASSDRPGCSFRSVLG
jgi:hypothetical protein